MNFLGLFPCRFCSFQSYLCHLFYVGIRVFTSYFCDSSVFFIGLAECGYLLNSLSSARMLLCCILQGGSVCYGEFCPCRSNCNKYR